MPQPQASGFAGYRSADLLEGFLCCIKSFTRANPRERCMHEQACTCLEMLPKINAAAHAALNQPLSEAELANCLGALSSPDQSDFFETETCSKLWETLRKTLCEIEPYAVSRRARLVPSTLDEVWSLLEASSLHAECPERSEGEARRRL